MVGSGVGGERGREEGRGCRGVMDLVPLEKRMLFAPSSTSFLPGITKITTFATFIWLVTSLHKQLGKK
jgi:hypothetical protein